MESSDTAYPHVALDARKVAYIEGTSMKVVELVMFQSAHGWSPAELHFQFPHLSLGQIHSALAFYWDHQEELDKDICRRTELVESLRQEAGPSILAVRFRAGGTLS